MDVNFYRSWAETMPEGMAIVEMDTLRVVMCNAALLRWTEDAVPQTMSELIASLNLTTSPAQVQALQQDLLSGQEFQAEVRLTPPNGLPVNLSVTVYSVVEAEKAYLVWMVDRKSVV